MIYVHYVVNHKSKRVHSLRKRLAFFAIDQVLSMRIAMLTLLLLIKLVVVIKEQFIMAP